MTPHRAQTAPQDGQPLLRSGLPATREARLAARRSFVEMKLAFMKVAAELHGSRGMLLQRQVRRANDPAELLVLHNDIIEALPRHTSRGEHLRNELNSQLDRLFPETQALGDLGTVA
jgi:hypothetical protein